MTRHPDWAARLAAFLAAHANTPFRYGAFDCCLFVCSAIEAMTGVDPAAEWRGAYASREGAMALVAKRHGARSVARVAAAVAAQCGMREIAPQYAQRGDALLLKRGRDYSLGLLALEGKSVMVAGAKGLRRAPLALAKRAWKV